MLTALVKQGFHKMLLLRKMTPSLKSKSNSKLHQHDRDLVAADMLTVYDGVAVMGSVMTEETAFQEIRENETAEEKEEDEEDGDN